MHPRDLTPTRMIPTTAHLRPASCSIVDYLAKGEPRVKTVGMREDSAHIDGEPFLSYKAFTYATSNLDYKRFLQEAKRVIQIPCTYTDAIISPEHKERKIAIDKEMKSLKYHDVHTTLFLSPACRTTISSDHASSSNKKRTAGSRLGLSFKDMSKNRVSTT